MNLKQVKVIFFVFKTILFKLDGIFNHKGRLKPLFS